MSSWSQRQRDACAFWAVHAHAHDLRDTSPPLVIKSPAMRSGKTKLVEVLERLVPRPLFVSGITVSFLERAIEAHRPTLLIDEYDALTGGDPALAEAARAQLNRSAKRRGARVGKNVPLPGGGYESRLFSTWAPTVIAGIGDPPSTVRDRAVVIDLKRKLSSEKVRPLRERDGADLAILRSKIARFVGDNEHAAARPLPRRAGRRQRSRQGYVGAAARHRRRSRAATGLGAPARRDWRWPRLRNRRRSMRTSGSSCSPTFATSSPRRSRLTTPTTKPRGRGDRPMARASPASACSRSCTGSRSGPGALGARRRN